MKRLYEGATAISAILLMLAAGTFFTFKVQDHKKEKKIKYRLEKKLRKRDFIHKQTIRNLEKENKCLEYQYQLQKDANSGTSVIRAVPIPKPNKEPIVKPKTRPKKNQKRPVKYVPKPIPLVSPPIEDKKGWFNWFSSAK